MAEEKGLKWEIDSAGTERFHIGEQAHPLTRKICAENGIDVSAHRARQLSTSDFENFDLLFSLATDVHEEMEDFAPDDPAMKRVRHFMDLIEPGKKLSVPDPWYGTEKDYHLVFEILSRGCEKFMKQQLKTL